MQQMHHAIMQRHATDAPCHHTTSCNRCTLPSHNVMQRTHPAIMQRHATDAPRHHATSCNRCTSPSCNQEVNFIRCERPALWADIQTQVALPPSPPPAFVQTRKNSLPPLIMCGERTLIVLPLWSHEYWWLENQQRTPFKATLQDTTPDLGEQHPHKPAEQMEWNGKKNKTAQASSTNGMRWQEKQAAQASSANGMQWQENNPRKPAAQIECNGKKSNLRKPAVQMERNGQNKMHKPAVQLDGMARKGTYASQQCKWNAMAKKLIHKPAVHIECNGKKSNLRKPVVLSPGSRGAERKALRMGGCHSVFCKT
eukprot:1157625-Pelagomonas_calceolata.AAC.4